MGHVWVDQRKLTLSEGSWSGRGDVRVRPEDAFAAARFEDLLELRSRAHARGYDALAEEYTDRIVSELASCADGLNGPGGPAA